MYRTTCNFRIDSAPEVPCSVCLADLSSEAELLLLTGMIRTVHMYGTVLSRSATAGETQSHTVMPAVRPHFTSKHGMRAKVSLDGNERERLWREPSLYDDLDHESSDEEYYDGDAENYGTNTSSRRFAREATRRRRCCGCGCCFWLCLLSMVGLIGVGVYEAYGAQMRQLCQQDTRA